MVSELAASRSTLPPNGGDSFGEEAKEAHLR